MTGSDGRASGSRRVVVTGGASGIGRACAERMARSGAAVAVLDIDETRAEVTAKEIREQGAEAVAARIDVGDEASVAAAVGGAAESLGGIDGLVVAAGVVTFGSVGDVSLEEWEAVLRINLTGTFLTIRAALPHLQAAGNASIVTIGSLASVVATPSGSSAAYKASKGGLLQLTRSVAVDYAGDGIRANCVCPGAVRTQLVAHSISVLPDLIVREKRGSGAVTAPISRSAEPEEVGGMVAFLLSDEASFITAATIMVDGGFTAI